MTDQDKSTDPDKTAGPESERDEFAELEQTIQRRLRSNQRFLERFLDEDFEDDELPADDEEEADGEEG